MITEKEVEKLDSIKPSEIEKLGAMQDPKTATAGKVLTADGKGKATYQPLESTGSTIVPTSVGTAIHKASFERSLPSEYNRESFPGYVIAVQENYHTVVYGFNSLPWYVKTDKTKVYLAPSDYISIKGKDYDHIFGVKQAAYDKWLADTADQADPYIQTGLYGRLKYEN